MTHESDQRLIKSQAGQISLLEEKLLQAKEKPAQTILFPAEWKLTPSQARLLAALAAAPNGFLTYPQIEPILVSWAHDSMNPMSTVSVQIFKMRHLLKPHGIELVTRWGIGTELPPASRAIVKAAMRQEVSP